MADHFKVDEEEERKIIINKYEAGREKIPLEDLNEWEDPTNEIYQVTDRYGFVHDYKLPEKLSKYENQLRETEAKRRDKWFKMIKNWNTYKTKNYDKLRDRVFKGIPNAVRGNAWLLLLDVPRIKEEQMNRYEEMYQLGKQYSKDVRQIDLDINRTFRNNMMFRERFNTKQQELFRVLVAYSVYNSEIGYCQGMSQIAALLLMFTSEEDTFWALDRLMSDDRYAMHGFFIPNFPKLHRFAKHHDLLLKKFLNKVYKHFRKLEIDSTIYTLKWFFQCFLDRVPFSLTLRLWDCFIIDGERILTCMSFTLLKLHKKMILKKNMETLLPFLQADLEKDFGYHDDAAIEELQKSIELLHKYRMDTPLDPPSESEKPSKPFGWISQTADTVSIINDDRSILESDANCKLFSSDREDDISIANTSRTASEIDVNEYREGEIDEIDDDFVTNIMNDDVCARKLSVYDNVDLNESFEAAKRLASEVDANLKQSNDSVEQMASSSEAIHTETKQLNGQSKYTQLEKNRTFILDNIEKSEENIEFVDQTHTSSLKDKLKRKSSIPTIKRTDNERRSNRKMNDNTKFESAESMQSSNHTKISTPNNKSSLIPRLNSSTKKMVESPNNNAIKSNFSLQSPIMMGDDTPRPIKIYVPYAETASKNSSRNSLTSSTNSIINLNNGLKGLNGKKDDLENKITIRSMLIKNVILQSSII